MSFLEKIDSPADIKRLPVEMLPNLASEVREKILECVSRTGGHLASSLGAVELNIALLKVFDPPKDKVVWDVGHQAYAWKILTGRKDSFATIRTLGGLSGFTNPTESEYDAFVAGHAGVAFAVATGMAAARDSNGSGEHVVAVVGDASMSNGESLEALNNASTLTKKMILVLNDNEMSISKNVGSFARFLGRLLTGARYNRMKLMAERAGHKLRLTFLRGPYHRLERMIKSLWLGNAFFESLGFRYVGPVDGHDIAALVEALEVAKNDKRSIVVHVVTQKGRGYVPAEENPTAWHGCGPFAYPDDLSDKSSKPAKRDWSAVFGEKVSALAREDGRICALTAAMAPGTGLVDFAKEFPKRFYDVGICEEFLVTFAAGLAKSGMRPIVAIYSTFLQRAVDQVMHDVCLLDLPVVLCVDRAGVVGADGRTHQGVFDIAMLRALPNLSILQPRNEAELDLMIRGAVAKGGPVVIRYPRGVPDGAGGEVAPLSWGKAEQVCGAGAKVQIWALGDQVAKALKVAEILKAKGSIDCGVVNARFVKPLDAELVKEQVSKGARIVTIENGSLIGGFGDGVRSVAGVNVRSFGWPDEFIPHGTQAELDEMYGLTAEKIAAEVMNG